jgi:hypothetical protein
MTQNTRIRCAIYGLLGLAMALFWLSNYQNAVILQQQHLIRQLSRPKQPNGPNNWPVVQQRIEQREL